MGKERMSEQKMEVRGKNVNQPTQHVLISQSKKMVFIGFCVQHFCQALLFLRLLFKPQRSKWSCHHFSALTRQGLEIPRSSDNRDPFSWRKGLFWRGDSMAVQPAKVPPPQTIPLHPLISLRISQNFITQSFQAYPLLNICFLTLFSPLQLLCSC